jgi:hypothetical protein
LLVPLFPHDQKGFGTKARAVSEGVCAAFIRGYYNNAVAKVHIGLLFSLRRGLLNVFEIVLTGFGKGIQLFVKKYNLRSLDLASA